MYSFILEPLLKEETIKTKKSQQNKRQNQAKNVKTIYCLKAEHKDKHTSIVVKFLLVAYISKYNLDPKEYTVNFLRINCKFLSVVLLL